MLKYWSNNVLELLDHYQTGFKATFVHFLLETFNLWTWAKSWTVFYFNHLNLELSSPFNEPYSGGSILCFLDEVEIDVKNDLTIIYWRQQFVREANLTSGTETEKRKLFNLVLERGSLLFEESLSRVPDVLNYCQSALSLGRQLLHFWRWCYGIITLAKSTSSHPKVLCESSRFM